MAYWRFKDDILLITSRKDRIRSFVVCARHRTQGVYRLEVEKVSRETVDMLSLRITRQGSRLIATPRPKPTAVMLSASSAHPSHIHRTWPLARLKSIFESCTDSRDANFFMTELIAQFRKFFAPEWLLTRM